MHNPGLKAYGSSTGFITGPKQLCWLSFNVVMVIIKTGLLVKVWRTFHLTSHEPLGREMKHVLSFTDEASWLRVEISSNFMTSSCWKIQPLRLIKKNVRCQFVVPRRSIGLQLQIIWVSAIAKTSHWDHSNSCFTRGNCFNRPRRGPDTIEMDLSLFLQRPLSAFFWVPFKLNN